MSDTHGWKQTIMTSDSPTNLFIRLAVGCVFLPEGIQKLIFPEILGSGRFADIGIPWPELMGPFVGWVELICGLFILLGFATRCNAMPLTGIMIVALISTKVPIWLGEDWWIFNVRELDRYGFWSMAHASRTDWAMLMGSIYLLIAGAGRWYVDAWLTRRKYSRLAD